MKTIRYNFNKFIKLISEDNNIKSGNYDFNILVSGNNNIDFEIQIIVNKKK